MKILKILKIMQNARKYSKVSLFKNNNPGMLWRGTRRRHKAKHPMVVGCGFFLSAYFGVAVTGGVKVHLVGLPHYVFIYVLFYVYELL